ncbi:MAG: hypothetical protein EBQ92_04345 [Proteobacteria bacterium]|nr:hypothetical protein [Pseudomonadota bacterium]
MVYFVENNKPQCSEVFRRLQENLPGRNLCDLAREHKIAIRFGSKKNKGWVGQTVEKVAGLKVSSEASPDGADFELKTTEVSFKDGKWIPKETLKITQVNPQQILEEEFESSIFWKKLNRLLIVAYDVHSEDLFQTRKIISTDLNNTKTAFEIRRFWEDVRHTICSGEIKDLINLGSSAGLVQLRPLGDGKQKSLCPITGEPFPARAFYATKNLLSLLLNQESL